jgi:hypothetical protein
MINWMLKNAVFEQPAEAEHRKAELNSGAVVAVPGDEAMARLTQAQARTRR